MPTISHIILMTTANVLANRDEDLRRLNRSIEAFRLRRPDVIIQHRMLLQCCTDVPLARNRFNFSHDMIVTACPQQVPLSVARNEMLDAVLAEANMQVSSSLIAFPDDDAWYPEGTLEYVYDRFESDPNLDFWFCRYGSDAAMPTDVVEEHATLQDAISRASSNTIFLRGRILQRIGGFDEALGLGTDAKSGEDTEFAMRAFFASGSVRYVQHRMIGHRDFDPQIRAKYFGGTLVALGRYAWRSPRSFIAFARKIAVGGALVAKRELPFSEFAKAWKMYAHNKAAPNQASVIGRPSGVIRPGKSSSQQG